MVLAVECSGCGPVQVTSSPRVASAAVTRHERRHDLDRLPPAVRLAAQSASLRLTVEQAKARIGMWIACPAMDSARNADQVLVEVLGLLKQDSGPPVTAHVEVRL